MPQGRAVNVKKLCSTMRKVLETLASSINNVRGTQRHEPNPRRGVFAMLNGRAMSPRRMGADKANILLFSSLRHMKFLEFVDTLELRQLSSRLPRLSVSEPGPPIYEQPMFADVRCTLVWCRLPRHLNNGLCLIHQVDSNSAVYY